MASLGSGNWTIAFQNDRSMDTVIENKKKAVFLQLTMASGEWPAAGIPLPGAGSAGLVRNLDRWVLNTPLLATASGRRFLFTLTTGHNIRAVAGRLTSGSGTAIISLATTVTVKSRIFYATAHGW